MGAEQTNGAWAQQITNLYVHFILLGSNLSKVSLRFDHFRTEKVASEPEMWGWACLHCPKSIELFPHQKEV